MEAFPTSGIQWSSVVDIEPVVVVVEEEAAVVLEGEG